MHCRGTYTYVIVEGDERNLIGSASTLGMQT